MKLTGIVAAVAAFGTLPVGVCAAEYHVERTLQIAHEKSDVWRQIGGFCDIDDWHPQVVACDVQVIEGALYRVLTTAEGDTFVDRRIAKEKGLSYTYRTTETALSVAEFTSTLSIQPLDGSLISWSVSFSSEDPAMEARVVELIETGLAGIGAVFAADR